VKNLSDGRALAPDYEADSFHWFLEMAGRKRMHGPLRKAVVRDASGDLAGWYLYYLEHGGMGHVLQFGARPNAAARVLDCLFYQALGGGAVGVAGQLEPRFTRILSSCRCHFDWSGFALVVQSRYKELLNAIYEGDAFFSRLEGEWWARFSDPERSRDDA